MNIIIGDIGNTITKICIVDSKSYKIKKELRFDSKKLNTDKYLKLKMKKLKKINLYKKKALFSSVVPKYK